MTAIAPQASSHEHKAVWWVHPTGLLCLFIIPLYLLVCAAPELLGSRALQLIFRSYLTWKHCLLGLLFLGVLAAGTAVGSLIIPRRAASRVAAAPVQDGYLEFLALATIGAYLLWFNGYILHPAQLLNLFTGGGVVGGREENATIPGVTTFTQLGIGYVVFYCDRVWRFSGAALARRFHWYFYLIFALALFRVYAWAERLAVIELAVPAVVLFVMLRFRSTGKPARLLVGLGPFAGILVLLAYFGATEFFRSWLAHYQYQNDDFWDFAIRRLLTYYYTALNNGAGMLEMLDWPTYKFEHLLVWLYRFPALVGRIFSFTFDIEDLDTPFLRRFADPEFNNPSGIFPVFLDAGVPAALVFAFLWGGLSGYLFRGCKSGIGVGRFLYPIVFLSLLEVMRLLYLSEPRAFPALLCVIVGYGFFMKTEPVRSPAFPVKRGARVALVRRPGHFSRFVRAR